MFQTICLMGIAVDWVSIPYCTLLTLNTLRCLISNHGSNKCLFTNVFAKNIYIHLWCEEAVYRAPIHIVTDDRQTDRQMQHCSNSVTILKNWFNKVMSFCLRFVKNIILTVNRLNSKQVKQNWTCLSCSTFRNHALNFSDCIHHHIIKELSSFRGN